MTARETREKVLITAAELAEKLRAGEPVTVLDVRWSLDSRDGWPAYQQGHIPGAVYVSLEEECSDAAVTGRGGHPLPTGRNLEAAARRWGVRRETLTVAYDDWNRAPSGRLWWMLTDSGLTGVRILDGGWGAWQAGGYDVQTGPEPGPTGPTPGNVTLLHEDLYDGSRPTVTAEQAGGGNVQMFDARAPERYTGEDELADPVAGHIPGAMNLPVGTVLNDDGTFRSTEELRKLFGERCGDIDAPVGAYCGSGVSATVLIAAMATTGRRAALFPGSWSEWSSDPSRPVARGAE